MKSLRSWSWALGAALLLATPAALAQDTEAPRPIREAKRLLLLGEFGWNSLAGLGVTAGYHLLPYLTAEAGAGFSFVRWKAGLRLRANLMPRSTWTPFVAAGAMIGSGEATEQVFSLGGPAVRYTIRPSPFAQLTAGVDYTGEDGVVFLASIGWAFLLRDNIAVTTGAPNATQTDWLNIAFGGGPVVALGLGTSF